MYLFYAAEVGTGTKVEPESRNSPFPLSSQREMLSIKVVWKRNAKWIPWACLDFSRATKILHHPKWKMPEDLFRYPQNEVKSRNPQNVIIRLPVVLSQQPQNYLYKSSIHLTKILYTWSYDLCMVEYGMPFQPFHNFRETMHIYFTKFKKLLHL